MSHERILSGGTQIPREGGNFFRRGRRHVQTNSQEEFHAAVDTLLEFGREGKLPRRGAFPLQGSGLIVVPQRLVQRFEAALTSKGFVKEVAPKPQS